MAKVSVPQPSNNQSNGKKDSRSGGKGSSPTAAAAAPSESATSREAGPHEAKKAEVVVPATEPVAPVKAAEKTVSTEPAAAAVVVSAPAAPSVETPAVEVEQPVSGGRKTFIDVSLRARLLLCVLLAVVLTWDVSGLCLFVFRRSVRRNRSCVVSAVCP